MYNTTFLLLLFQLNNSPFFPSTDESLCRNVKNAQCWVGDRLILIFFSLLWVFIHMNSSLQLPFFPLDQNEKSKFQKP